MEDHFDKIEWLLSKWDFEELKESDRELVIKSLGSREAYQFARQSILQAKQSKEEIPQNPYMKASLLEMLDKKKGLARPPQHKNPLRRKIPASYAAAVLALLLIPVVILLNKEPEVVREISYVERPTVPDTVYVSLPQDTLFIDRVSYQTVYVKEPSVINTAKAENEDATVENAPKEVVETPTISTVSTSLAENKTLNELLVSVQ